MVRTRVKICGITRPEDMRAAVDAGADAVGLVFCASSPRRVSVEAAAAIVAATPPFVTTAGLFVDASKEEVDRVLAQVPLDLLQFHGEESPAFCSGFGRPFIRALRMKEGLDVDAEARRYQREGARAILLDAYVPGVAGGTGRTFDWAAIPAGLPLPVVLAGGLDAGNVAAAIIRVRPWAVDVSGGVEARDGAGTRLPGIKSPAAITAFIRGVESVRTA